MKFDSPEALEEYIDSQRIEFYKVAVVDIDGVLRGKYMSRDKLSSALRKGFGFCDVVVGWDSQDQLYDNGQLSGWHTGYRDASVRLDLGTARLLPMEDDTLFLLGNLQGSYAEACSRTILSRVVKWAQDLGFSVEAAL